MDFIWYIVTGVVGGLFGGMGMGGGTLLIPLLNIFCGVKQHTAQAINLLSFIAMAIVALIIHIKNKLVNFDRVLFIIIPGIVTCVGGCLVAKVLSGDILARLFGGFLLLLAVFQFVGVFKSKKDKNR